MVYFISFYSVVTVANAIWEVFFSIKLVHTLDLSPLWVYNIDILIFYKKLGLDQKRIQV